MRMTEGLIGLMIFGLLTYFTTDYSASGASILSGLYIEDPSHFTSAGSLLATGGVISGALALGTYFLSGGSWSSTITAGAIGFVVGLTASPATVILGSDAPYFAKILVGGTWLMLMISTIGAALRGEF